MSNGVVETFHEDGAWYNRVEGEPGYLGDGYSTQDEAVLAGREAALARGAAQIVQNTDRRIGQRNSRDDEPRQTRG
ncbi:DUF2188 domain-containing protein [Microbacterium sp. ISL-59]|uniref:DUF2188 domain-containing protein n=1 Tax=Microbacterium sp. ISL-59 TaxID=2819159 RepID=UPI001BEB2D74|nr:DUF2188 domain-containing protein [Microbacterium sp. ISL-59]MBT2496220.1 DUF2188 domain-containing protein [Microbacterium sp. ISL-59]